VSDDKPKRRSPDVDRIDLGNPEQIRNWCKSLGVTEAALRSAVAKAGTHAQKVRECLGETRSLRP
jgi:hypothetical protein